MKIDQNRFYVIDNEIHGSFSDYVAIIKHHISEYLDPCKIFWSVEFSKGDGYNEKSQ